ncbi:MAG: CpsD/CapB family tyrosine-protein kinase [Planctomycetota bacterium]
MRNVLIDGDQRGLRSEVLMAELGHLWTHLLQRGAVDSYRSIGFCAIGDDEGSNTLAANLALYLGSKGTRTALIEATLRAPVMSGLFEVTGSPGLADLLADRATLRDVVRARVAPGVDVVPAGESADPFWGFTSDRFGDTLRELLTERDLCLVDVPGLNRAPEAALVVRSLDAVVLVVEANRHAADVVRRNVSYLRSLGTPFLGAVLADLVYDLPTAIARLT